MEKNDDNAGIGALSELTRVLANMPLAPALTAAKVNNDKHISLAKRSESLKRSMAKGLRLRDLKQSMAELVKHCKRNGDSSVIGMAKFGTIYTLFEDAFLNNMDEADEECKESCRGIVPLLTTSSTSLLCAALLDPGGEMPSELDISTLLSTCTSFIAAVELLATTGVVTISSDILESLPLVRQHQSLVEAIPGHPELRFFSAVCQCRVFETGQSPHVRSGGH